MNIAEAKALESMPEDKNIVVLTNEDGKNIGEVIRLFDGSYTAAVYNDAGWPRGGLERVSWQEAVSSLASRSPAADNPERSLKGRTT